MKKIMKNTITIFMVALCLFVGGCKKESAPVTIKESPDKYTWYVKDYVGKNCASFGYTSMAGKRMEKYGAGIMEIVFMDSKGNYIDASDEEIIKEYVVTAQNLKPNTELKLSFGVDKNGVEYSEYAERMNYDEIIFRVKKVGEEDAKNSKMTQINSSPDKYTRYIVDYVGRNLANCGYISMAGDFRDKYDNGTVKLIIVTDDGSYVDSDDEDELKKYVVIDQNVAPNTELKLYYKTDANGNETSDYPESQSIEEIELFVKCIE